MKPVDRRSLLRNLSGSAAALSLVPRYAMSEFLRAMRSERGDGARQEQRIIRPNGQENGEMQRMCVAFLGQFFAPALAVAIVRQGAFVVEKAVGQADPAMHEQTSVNTLFRIADVSKPITAVAIFTLIEAGKLQLSDKVFGAGGGF